jgi:hypothetical protein
MQLKNSRNRDLKSEESGNITPFKRKFEESKLRPFVIIFVHFVAKHFSHQDTKTQR